MLRLCTLWNLLPADVRDSDITFIFPPGLHIYLSAQLFRLYVRVSLSNDAIISIAATYE